MDPEQAWERYAQAVRFGTSLVLVPDTTETEEPEQPQDIIAIRVGGVRPRIEARPVPPHAIEILGTGRIERFDPAAYRMVEYGSQIAMSIFDEQGEVHGHIRRPLDGLIARITYRCSEDHGERLALTIHEGMKPHPVERIEFGPRTSFLETFDVPLTGNIDSGRYVFVLWRTGLPTYACPEASEGWTIYGYFRRDLTKDDILGKVAGISKN